jgi:osmotically-inducible protein OsmY
MRSDDVEDGLMRRLLKSLVCAAALSSLALGTSAGWAANPSENGAVMTGSSAQQIIVTGRRDAALARRVEAALLAAPYLYAEHVNVQSKNGVITLRGMVADYQDLQTTLRISGSVHGVKRVVDELEMYGDLGDFYSG